MRTAAQTEAYIRCQCTEDGDCLLWNGKLNKAQAPIAGGSMRRKYWQATVGPIPEGQIPHPTCGRPTCLAHLELFTLSQIMRTTIARPDIAARWKVAGRGRGKKIDMETARAIRESDLTQRAKARAFNVTQGLVSRIENNLVWTENAFDPFAGLGARA